MPTLSVHELIDKLQEIARSGHGNERVMVLPSPGANSRPPLSVTDATTEHHEDAGGAITVWVHAEEI